MADSTQDELGESRFGAIPIEVTIRVGTARPLISELLTLEQDTVLPLDRAIDDPVELFVGDRLIARGSLEEMESTGSGKLGVRITEVVSVPVDPS